MLTIKSFGGSDSNTIEVKNEIKNYDIVAYSVMGVNAWIIAHALELVCKTLVFTSQDETGNIVPKYTVFFQLPKRSKFVQSGAFSNKNDLIDYTDRLTLPLDGVACNNLIADIGTHKIQFRAVAKVFARGESYLFKKEYKNETIERLLPTLTNSFTLRLLQCNKDIRIEYGTYRNSVSIEIGNRARLNSEDDFVDILAG